jgi:hypothetical protein
LYSEISKVALQSWQRKVPSLLHPKQKAGKKSSKRKFLILLLFTVLLSYFYDIIEKSNPKSKALNPKSRLEIEDPRQQSGQIQNSNV